MILVVAGGADAVAGRLRGLLAAQGADAGFVDLQRAADHRFVRGAARGPQARRWCIEGGECTGRRPVTALFIRRGPHAGAEPDPAAVFMSRLDRLLIGSDCRVANRSWPATGNYAKLHQLRRLAAAGFQVPRTLATASPDDARRFIVELQGRVVLKGLSSLRSRPRVLTPEHLRQLDSLRDCPAQFQQLVEGMEYRVTVVGGRSWAAQVRPRAEPSCDAERVLPAVVVARCIRFVADAGLMLAGFDLIVDQAGGCWCLEMNPNPFFIHHEDAADPVLTRAVTDDLLACSQRPGAFFA